MSFSNYFQNLPRTILSPAESALREQAVAGTKLGAAPADVVASAQYSTAITSAERAASVGMYTADVSTKAAESMVAIDSKFSSFAPFTKAGANVPTFSTIYSGDMSGLPAATYGSTGLTTDARQTAAYNATVPLPSAAQYNSVLNQSSSVEDRSHLVTLTDGEGYVLEFLVMPEIVENRSVDYEPVAPAQFPGAFQKYKGTQSVQWSINATLISRTTDEATLNLSHLNRLRGWTMPFFGENTQSYKDALGTEPFKTKLGAPPPVLKFKGLRKGIIGEVPVVITSLNWNWPRDVDYIPAHELIDDATPDRKHLKDRGTTASIPFPTVITLAIQLVESFSTDQFNNFSLVDYRNGDMVNAYGKKVSRPNIQTGEQPKQQEAQTLGRSAPSFSDTDPRRLDLKTTLPSLPSTGAGGGRGFVNPEYVKPAISEMKQATPAPFKPEQGGDYSGAGASGGF